MRKTLKIGNFITINPNTVKPEWVEKFGIGPFEVTGKERYNKWRSYQISLRVGEKIITMGTAMPWAKSTHHPCRIKEIFVLKKKYA